ncbi:MAG: hypothetical protein JWL68_716, partial [Actinomycetia bacterium]|nr:hypothetical protein [Actinomycetes bacterium]
ALPAEDSGLREHGEGLREHAELDDHPELSERS